MILNAKPTSVVELARSKIVTLWPFFAREIAAAGPPIPAPTMSTLRGIVADESVLILGDDNLACLRDDN